MRTANPKAPTREKILASSIKLMADQGYAATSVEEIIEDAGATKGSFFHFFHSKEDLAKAALNRLARDLCKKMAAAPFQKEKDPQKKVVGRLNDDIAHFKDPLTRKSCLLGNLSQELATSHPEFRKLCGEIFSLVSEEFKRDLESAGIKNASSVGDLYVSIIQGSMILMKAKKDNSVAAGNLEHFKKYVQSQMNGTRKKPKGHSSR